MLLRPQATTVTSTPSSARRVPCRRPVPTVSAARAAGAARRSLASSSTLTPAPRCRLSAVVVANAVSSNFPIGNGDVAASRVRPFDAHRPLLSSSAPSTSLIDRLERREGILGAMNKYKNNNKDTAEFETAAKPIVATTTTTTTTKFTRLAARCVAFALVLVMAFTASTPSALAARSGGRIGGSSFGGGASAAAFSSSYRGGGGFYGASSSSRFSSSSSHRGTISSLRSSVTPHAFSSSPTRLNSLTLGWGLVPFGGFGYGGYPVYAGGGGFGLGDILTFGVFALIAFSAISSFTRARSDSDYDDDEDGQAYDEGVTVAKLQVGLLANAKGLKRDLERIAAKADTSTPSGLHYVLQETVLSLLRNPQYAVYGAAKTLKGKSLAKAEQKFNEMSLAERGKVREETLVNVAGIRREGGFKGKGTPGPASSVPGDEELIVVTVIVASKGRFKLPAVRSGAELREALSTLGAVPSDGVLGVEVLWTPQDPQDSYSRSELMLDFPDLNNL